MVEGDVEYGECLESQRIWWRWDSPVTAGFSVQKGNGFVGCCGEMTAEVGNSGCWFVKMEVGGSDGGFHVARV